MGYLYDPLKETFVSDTAATDLEKDVPVRKPNAVPPKIKTIKKLKNGGTVNKTSTLDNIIPNVIKYSDMYDSKPSVSKPKVKPKTNLNTWQLMKQVEQENLKSKDPLVKKEARKNLREFKKIENNGKSKPFVKKISNIDQRTVTKTPEPMPIVPLNFFQINQEKDPVMIAKENQFRQMLQESERRRNKLEGLAYLMGFKE